MTFTEWLLDLIWIGNTLYPRWFVFAVCAFPFVIFAVISAIYDR